MNGHEFVTVKNRRWCLGCDLFQMKRSYEESFPVPKNTCPKNTPHAQKTGSTSAQEFRNMILFGLERQRLIREFPGLVRAEHLTVPELRALWDSIDDSGSTDTADPEIPGETVHFVLNQKGDGHYCAV